MFPRTIASVLLAVGILILSSVMWDGCARTFVKEYLLPTEEPAVTAVGEFEIEVVFRALKIRDTEGVNSFRLYLVATHGRRLAAAEEINEISEIDISNVCIRMIGFDSTICPGKLSVLRDAPLTGQPDDDKQYGATFRYDTIELDDEKQEIELTFDVALTDRESGEPLTTRTVSHRLVRNHRTQIYHN